MNSVAQKIEEKYKKKNVVDIKSGDTIKVHQKVREGGKERIQIFEGMVLRVTRRGSLSGTFTVRRISSGVGVEKTFLIHAPNILKIEVVKRTKVRRNYLTYMRELTGKSVRLAGVDFDREAVNVIHDEKAEAEEAKIHEEALAKHDELAAKEAQERAKEEAKAEAALAKHQAKAEAEQSEATSDAKGPAVSQEKE
ncbi:50S ribosomal protein L19 [Candidatus Saccharibacteria bacterium]|nr:50S ribosomal protein L19 [Candidatus Saccharibacteria bacterium]